MHNSSASRAWIVDCLRRTDSLRELIRACSRYGHLLGTLGASPTFASRTLEGLQDGLPLEWLSPLRAALLEAYVLARTEEVSTQAKATWNYPACRVRFGAGNIGIIACYPYSDGVDLAHWADHVAQSALGEGARRAWVDGNENVIEVLRRSLEHVGVEVVGNAPSKKSWFRWPFSKWG